MAHKLGFSSDFSWDFIVIQWDINGIYPLVNVYSLLLKMVI